MSVSAFNCTFLSVVHRQYTYGLPSLSQAPSAKVSANQTGASPCSEPRILTILLRAGFISFITCGTIAGPNPVAFNNVKEYEHWIWMNLKYCDDQPVSTNMELINRPSQQVVMSLSDFRLILLEVRILVSNAYEHTMDRYFCIKLLYSSFCASLSFCVNYLQLYSSFLIASTHLFIPLDPCFLDSSVAKVWLRTEV